MVKLDQPLLEQCLRNLLINAAAWSKAGTKITVCGDVDGDKLVLSVLDEEILRLVLNWRRRGADSALGYAAHRLLGGEDARDAHSKLVRIARVV